MKQKRWLSWFVCCALLMSLIPMGILPAAAAGGVDTTRLTCYGRTYENDGVLYLYWTNAGFSFSFNGTGATATLTASNQTEIYWGYLNVYVDGAFAPSQTICLDKATQTVTLAEGLTPGEHTIEVRKRNEAAYGGSSTIGVTALSVTDGDFLDPPAAPARQIEVIGDSITSGFGNLDPDGTYPMFTTALEEGTMTYAVLAAKQLGANASIISRSGIGFCQNATCDSFYPYYTKAASLPGNNAPGGTAEWDFAAQPNDVVVINLGTNDNGAKINGQTISDATMTEEAAAFLRLVRESNPDAVIIWTYGLMGNSRRSALEAAVNTLAAEGDDKVFYLALTPFVGTTEGQGTHGHPGMQADINRSAVLAQFIAEKTGWAWDASALLQAQVQYSSQFNTEEALADYTAMSARSFTKALDAAQTLLASGADNAALQAAQEDIWQSYVGLMSADEVSSEYILIDSFESVSGIQFGNGRGSVDTENAKEGEGCLTNTGSSGLICINRQSYNITLPEDWQEWYLEGWIYISDPDALPGESCLEVSQAVDNIEIAWAISSLGLQAGWNKIQLPMGQSQTSISKEKMETLKNIRLYMVNVQKEITVKVDHFVLAKGRAAADTDAWQQALDAAETALAAEENAALRAAYERAREAVSQADVDVATAQLNAALAALEAQGPARITAGENPELFTTYGRTWIAQNGTLYLYWTNSGASVTFTGTGLTANLYSDSLNEQYPGYLNVYVDGAFAPAQTIRLTDSLGSYTLAEGLEPGEHTVELRKRSEPVPGGNTLIGIRSLTATDGGFLAPPARAEHTIEVIGDSITCGFGNIATDADTNFTTHTEDGTMTYAVLAAKELNADVSVVARSGIHYCHSRKSDGTAVDNFYDVYAQTAVVPGASANTEQWDFAADPRDVVVINLGTNDVGAARDSATYTAEAVDFLKLVREKNPDALIIWTYGMMGSSIRPALEAAVKQMNDAGDANIYYLPLENYVSTTEGVALGHPTVQTDVNRSVVLAQFIAEKTGWEVDATPMLQAQLQISAPYAAAGALDGYTEETAAVFTAAYAAGEALLNDESADNAVLQEAAEAIWKAQWGLLAKGEITGEYIVIHNMDSKTGWSFSGAPNGVETADYVEGDGCLYTTWNGGNMVNINTSALNVELPEDWEDWYLECWMYVDHPENIPSGSCLEISQVVDNIEVQWGLDGLSLQPGWNKVQLRMGGGGVSNGDQFTTVKNLRMFIVNMTEGPLTFKVDNIVLSKGRVAADTRDYEQALSAAAERLAAGEDAALRAVYERALLAQSQADVDAAAKRLTAAVAAAGEPSAALLGDVNGDGDIDTTDARLTLQYAARRIKEDKLANFAAADVNGDGAVDTTDARLILQHAAHRIAKFPAEG